MKAAALALCAVVMSPASVSISAQAPAPAAGAPAQATPPAPRFPDGHLNLGSAPDQKGYWEVRPGLGGFPRQADVPFQPWAKALAEYRASRVDLYPPLVNCKPGPGPSFN